MGTIKKYIKETKFIPITDEQYKVLKKLHILQFGSELCEEALESIECGDDDEDE